MPIGNITQTISELPAAGKRGVDVQTVFVNKQEDFQDHLQGTTVDELNTLKDQLNSRIGEINSTTTTMNGYADTASAGASTATTKAGEASTSASEALTSRNQAETFKNNASASASTASQWADNAYNAEVETGRYSAKHWSVVAENAVQAASSVPSGTVITIAKNTAPTGYLKANGALISRTVYAYLFAAIGTTFGEGDGSTTFALPDLRGYFQRGWDDGRGVDTGRVFGSLQQDSYLNHSHTANSVSAGSHTHTSTGVPSGGYKTGNGGIGTSTTLGSSNNTTNATIGSGGDHTHTITVDSSTTGTTETRPKNIALLYCIKY